MLSKISKQYAYAYLNNKVAIAKMLQGSRFHLANASYHTLATYKQRQQTLMQMQARSMQTDATDAEHDFDTEFNSVKLETLV